MSGVSEEELQRVATVVSKVATLDEESRGLNRELAALRGDQLLRCRPGQPREWWPPREQMEATWDLIHCLTRIMTEVETMTRRAQDLAGMLT